MHAQKFSWSWSLLANDPKALSHKWIFLILFVCSWWTSKASCSSIIQSRSTYFLRHLKNRIYSDNRTQYSYYRLIMPSVSVLSPAIAPTWLDMWDRLLYRLLYPRSYHSAVIDTALTSSRMWKWPPLLSFMTTVFDIFKIDMLLPTRVIHFDKVSVQFFFLPRQAPHRFWQVTRTSKHFLSLPTQAIHPVMDFSFVFVLPSIVFVSPV